MMGHTLSSRFTTTTVFLLLATFLAHSAEVVQTKDCSLYKSPVGFVCFHGDEVTTALTNSSTSWVVEFYSSWCGHCQHFAPIWKRLATDIERWSHVVRLGVIDCSSSDNRQTCSTYNIPAYPTIRFFHAHDALPKENRHSYRGQRTIPVLRAAIVSHVESLPSSSRPLDWPSFQPMVNDKILSLPASAWRPTVLEFENASSSLGKELILDFSGTKDFTIFRVSRENGPLVKHYSILEFPSIVVEWEKDSYYVIAGHSFEDPRTNFRKAIQEHLAVASTTSLPTPSPFSPESDSRGRGGLRKGQEASRTITRISRSNEADLLSAISYAFRIEVPMHSIVSGSAFTALMRFVHLVESAFRNTYPAISLNLWAVRTRLESRQSSGFILNRDWIRILDTKLDPNLFPKEPQWTSCAGSEPHFRGYPCGLWMLMHTITVLTLPLRSRRQLLPKQRIYSKEALSILSNFVRNFFSCEYCREHFSEMAQTLYEGEVRYNGDALLWLWEAHNIVNRRVKGSISTDPVHPKNLFPSSQMCPYCYKQTGGAHMHSRPTWNNTAFAKDESLLRMPDNQPAAYVWNRTAILLFLWNFYHLNKTDSSTPYEILRAAWPKHFDSTDKFHEKYHAINDLGLNGYDISLCFMAYAMCAVFLVILAFWLLRRRRLRRFLLYP